MTHEELIKALREKHRAYVGTYNPTAGQIFADAADAIEQLLNEQEKEHRIVKAVFGELLPYENRTSFLGSLTLAEMCELYSRIAHEPYCKRHGIKFEDMTEEDFEREAEEDFHEVSEYDYFESLGDDEEFHC